MNAAILVENSSYIRTIVTDSGLSEDWQRKLRAHGIELFVADPAL
jgi:DeoR/GlpR family transcriptional regulator of sugar metabolism